MRKLASFLSGRRGTKRVLREYVVRLNPRGRDDDVEERRERTRFGLDVRGHDASTESGSMLVAGWDDGCLLRRTRGADRELGASPSRREPSKNGLNKGRERRDSNPRPPA